MGERIIVVEDTPAIAQIMSRILERHGYTVTMLPHGINLLEHITTIHPAIVLMDVSLPIKDGWMLIEEIRREPTMQEIPVIAVTAHTSDDDRKRALTSGYSDFVCKPFDYRELLQLVGRHIHASC